MRFRSISFAALAMLPIALSAQFLDPNVLKKPNAGRRLAHLSRRLFGQALQRAQSDQ